MNPPRLSATLVAAPFFWLLAAGCTPEPVYRLELADNEPASYWDFGQAVAAQEDAGIAVEVAYDWTSYEGHVLDVEVTNRSDSTVLVDPAAFYYLALRRLADTSGTTVHALDPEAYLLELDLNESREVAQERTALAFEAVGAVAEFAGEVATANEPQTPEEEAAEAAEDLEDEIHYAERAADYEAEIASLNTRRERWANATVRKTTLPPGTSLYGKVYFPVFETSARPRRTSYRPYPPRPYLVLHFPVGPSRTRFFYVQRRYQP